ncbi:MAG: hypothetical protein R8J85_01015 [Mariprofundales bacterium]
MSKKLFKRRKLLIDPVFQYRFVKRVTIMVVGVMANATIGVLFVTSLLQREVAQPDPFSSQLTMSLQLMPDLLWMSQHLWPYFLLALLLVVVISILFGLVESFHIAGPVFRMRHILKAMSRGDFSEKPVLLRKRDELTPLYKEVVLVHGEWKQRVTRLQCFCNEEGTAEEHLLKIKAELSSCLTERSQ